MSFEMNNVLYKNIMMEECDENDLDETILDEESEVDQNINTIKKEVSEHLNLSEMNPYEDKSDGENEDFRSNSESLFIGVKQEWSAEGEIPSKSMESFDSEDERSEFYIEKESDVEEEDEEETIAMFVTASGQQLALYAVEDSDDYFAVAVYDESGEPPTNFQFLMKSDVERLIREGAVRTVKKPTQIKKQLVTTQPPALIYKEEFTGDVIPKAESQIESINRRQAENKKTNVASNYIKPVIKSPPPPKVISVEDSGSDEELVEQSTVQYILCDGDQSDPELTFDDIQANLEASQRIVNKPPISEPPVKNPSPERKKTNNGLVYVTSPPVRNTSYRGVFYPPKAAKVEPQSPSRQPPVKRSHISNTSIIGSKQNHGIKRELSPISDHFTPNLSANFSENTSNFQSKGKRCRKQQLTSVNREDSEIIIQPASMLEAEEDEPTPKKRRRRRKKTAAYEKPPKPTRKSKRRRSRVEIIDIDVDEDEEDSDEPSRGKKILEITLDENKEKGSSDKENEVIMVRDSDDEEEDSSKALKCSLCSNSFKLRRALDSHVKICSKLRSRSRRFSSRGTRADSDSDEESYTEKSTKKRTKRKNSTQSKKEKKKYACKICHENFDLVVALARHTRSEHSKKKGRPTQKTEVTRVANRKYEEKKPKEKNTPRSEEEDLLEEKKLCCEEKLPDEKKKPKALKKTKGNPSRKNKLIPINLNRKWRPMELTCINCNRWFSSAVALETHSLQHVTKKSAKKVYRCPICKKLFKSQFLFMKHKRMHSKAKSEKNETLKTTQSKKKATSKVSTRRSRGTPRELSSNI